MRSLKIFNPRFITNPSARLLYLNTPKPKPYDPNRKPRVGISRSVTLRLCPTDKHFPSICPFNKFLLSLETQTRDNVCVYVWTSIQHSKNINPLVHENKWLNQLEEVINETDFETLKEKHSDIVSKIINKYRLEVKPHEIILNLDLTVATKN